MASKSFPVTKDAMFKYASDKAEYQNGAGSRLIAGRYSASGYDYMAALKADIDWTGIGRITKVELRLVISTDFYFAVHGNRSCICVRRLSQSFPEDTGTGDSGSNPEWTPWTYTNYGQTVTGQGTLVFSHAHNTAILVDITAIGETWAPNTVQKRNGDPGDGATNNGVLVQPWDNLLHKVPVLDEQFLYQFYSRDWTGTSSYKPTIVITYDDALVAPDVPTNLVPFGTQSPVTNFTGDFVSDCGATLELTEITVYDSTGVTQRWTTSAVATASEVAGNAYSVPIPELVKFLTTYTYKVRVRDSNGLYSDWTNLTSFTLTNQQPTLVLSPAALGTRATLAGTRFRGEFSDADATDKLSSLRIQLRTTTADGDPAWDSGNLWDTGNVSPTTSERSAGVFSRLYGGKELAAGSYSWRAKVADRWGSWSAWQYGSVTLSQGYDPDPGAIDFMTSYSTRATPTRVVIKAMGTNRGPGAVLATIEDATHLGASKYLNSPGEFYMTLPATHPQVSVIEPYQVHYQVLVWRGDRYRECFAGLITDFDATEDDVVFYGVDYLGLLKFLVDTRYDAAYPDKPPAQGGSKYTDQTLTSIISDQLTVAKAKTDSPIKFITLGTFDSFTERASLYTTFGEVFQTVTQLVESHRQGTGKRSRIQVRDKTSGGYEFLLQDDPGKTRDNIRMEFGGLVQGFRLTAFGDFGTLVHSIGRVRDATKAIYKSATAPGVPTATWGLIEKVNAYTDIYDENDLTRRTKQAAATTGRVGKRVALGLRTDALLPFDGYDIGDSIPVHIKRGVVDTTAYGSGYWSIMGVEWRLSPDGHTELTLVVLPKEDGVAPDTDLIPSLPILGGAEWEVGYDPPVQGTNIGKVYLDLSTGKVWEKQSDGSWSLVDQPGTPQPPSGLSITTTNTQDSSGNPIVKLTLTLSGAQTGDDYRGHYVEFTNEYTGSGEDAVPDWTHSTILFIPAGETSVSIDGVRGGTLYFARAWAVDFVGVSSSITAASQPEPGATDDTAPGTPQSISMTEGAGAFGVMWSPSESKDLAFYEFRYARDDGSGTGRGSNPWTTIRLKASSAWIGGLLVKTKYWGQVRAVDTSGNVEDTSTQPPTAVYYLNNPDTGWGSLTSCTTKAVDDTLLDTGFIGDQHINAAGLSAASIRTGVLQIQTSDASMIDGIEVYDSGVKVGMWNETGLYIYDAADVDTFTHLNNAGLTVYSAGAPVAAITPSGINASAITFGTVPGGHNIIANSSFELANFDTASSLNVTWTVQADWTATEYQNVNVTANTNDLTATFSATS